MSEQKRPFMDEEDFDALLARSVPEMPPDDIVARTIPGKEALGRIFTGYFLYTFVIHFIGLDLILPVIGQILVLLGFRALQHENRWFNACYLHQTNIIRTSSSLWGTGSDYLFISRDMKIHISQTAL